MSLSNSLVPVIFLILMGTLGLLYGITNQITEF
jgi:hypothetical protein